MTFHRRLTDAERAGRALAHPLILLMSDRTIAALSEIATSGSPLTAAERRLQHDVLAVLDAGEILLSRRTA